MIARMVISVLGATGLVGRALIALLEAEGQVTKVQALVRKRPQLITQKTEWLEVNFEAKDEWAPLIVGDALFCTMGTTLKRAGSQQAQRRVDFDYQYWGAEAALQNGVKQIALVSAHGAKATSRIFYPRLKGELEEAVIALGFEHTVILRPTFLDGERGEKRTGEEAALKVLRLLPQWNALGGLRPVPVEKVAVAGLNALKAPGAAKVQLLDASMIQRIKA